MITLLYQAYPQYNGDVLFLVVLNHKYGEQAPLWLGTLVIHHLVVTMTTEELQQAGETLNQVHSNTVLSKRNAVESPSIYKYDLKGVKGKIQIMQKVLILSFTAIVAKAKGAAKLMTHSKWMLLLSKF